MNPSTLNLLLFSWLLSLALLFMASEAGFLLHKADIIICNDLNPDLDLTIHCKSKDSDLGIQRLAYVEDFEFKFRPNVWGTTLYYCSMQWNGTSHWFDIYVQNRDSPLCNRCLWKIRPKGPCMFNYKTSKYDICYPWNIDA